MSNNFREEEVDFQGFRGVNAADPINDTDLVNLRTLFSSVESITSTTLSRITLRNKGIGYPVYEGIINSTHFFRSLSSGTNLYMVSGDTIIIGLNDEISLYGITANTITAGTIDAALILSAGSPLSFSFNEIIWCASTGSQSIIRNNFTNSQALGNFSIIGGAYGYSTGNFTTIAGGSGNSIFNHYATVGGGYRNRASGFTSVIGGGSENQTNGQHSSILGGFGNQALRNFSNILGGFGNLQTGVFGTIIGGNSNSGESNYNLLGGGSINQVTGLFGIQLGGYRNYMHAPYGFGGNGKNNIIDSGSTYSVLLNGKLNRLFSGSAFSLILNGVNNSVGHNSPYSTVINGVGNIIQSAATGNTILVGNNNFIKTGINNSSILAGRGLSALSSNTTYFEHAVSNSMTGNGINLVLAEADGHLIRGVALSALTASTSISAQNISTGQTIYSATTGGVLQFKTITGGTFTTAYTENNLVFIGATDWEPSIGTLSIIQQNNLSPNLSHSLYGFVQGSANKDYGVFSNIIVGGSINKIYSSSLYSGIFASMNSKIYDGGNKSLIVGGHSSYIYNFGLLNSIFSSSYSTIYSSSTLSNIISSLQSKIGISNSSSSIKNSILSSIGDFGKLNTIIGSEYSIINSNNSGASRRNTIIGGDLNIVNSGLTGSTILGGTGITATTSNTTYVPQLNIQSISNGGTYMLTWDPTSGSVLKGTIPVGGSGGTTFTGITNIGSGNAQIYKQTNLGVIQLRSLSGGNQINISTGDTHLINLNPNISVNTLTANTVSATTISGGTYFSSSTPFTSIFVGGGQNLGNGEPVFSAKTNGNLQFRTLSGGTFTTAYTEGDLIVISSTDWKPSNGILSIIQYNLIGTNISNSQYGFVQGSANLDYGLFSNTIIGGILNRIYGASQYSGMFSTTRSKIGSNTNKSVIIGGEYSYINDFSSQNFISCSNYATIYSSSTFNSLLTSSQSSIGDYTNFSLLNSVNFSTIGRQNRFTNISNSISSTIGDFGNLNTIIGSEYSSINTISVSSGRNRRNTIIGGNLNIVNSGLTGSTILGGTGITAITSNTTYIPQLNIQSVSNGGNYMLTWDSVSGSVLKGTIPVGGSGNITSSINTGGTHGIYSHISGSSVLVFKSLSAGSNILITSSSTENSIALRADIFVSSITANTIAGNLISGTTLQSGNTNLNQIFAHTGHTHPLTDILNGNLGDTIRHNGTNWIANPFLYNPGYKIGINNTNINSVFSVQGTGSTTASTVFWVKNSGATSSGNLMKIFDSGLVQLGNYIGNSPESVISYSRDLNTTISKLHITDSGTYPNSPHNITVLIDGQSGNGGTGNTALYVRSNLDNSSTDVVALFEHGNTIGLTPNLTNSIIRVIGGADGIERTGFTINSNCYTAFGTGTADNTTEVLIKPENRGSMSTWNLLKLVDSGSSEVFSIKGDGTTAIRSLTSLTTSMVVADLNGVLSIQAIPTGSGGTGNGTITSAINTGGTHGIYSHTSGSSVLVLKSLSAGSNILITSSATENSIALEPNVSITTLTATTLSSTTLSATNIFVSGITTVLSGQNVGNGTHTIFKQKLNNNLQFYSLQGSTVEITLGGNELNFNVIPSVLQGASVWTKSTGYGSAQAHPDLNPITPGYSLGDYSIVFGKDNRILNASNSSSIIGGGYAIIYQNSSYSSILGGRSNQILSGSSTSSIIGGNGNIIYSNTFAASIIGGQTNKIYSNSSYSIIIGGHSNKLTYTTRYSGIFAGYRNTIANVQYSAIIGGYNLTCAQANTVVVPRLRIAQSTLSTPTYILSCDNNGYVSRILTGTFAQSVLSTNVNGINTFTGGTTSAQTINVTALTIASLIVSGDTTLNGVTAQTLSSTTINALNIFSANTINLNNLFSHSGHTHQLSALLNTAHTHSVSELSGGTLGNTIYNNGTNWTYDNALYNPGYKIGIGITNSVAKVAIQSSGSTTGSTAFRVTNSGDTLGTRELIKVFDSGLIEMGHDHGLNASLNPTTYVFPLTYSDHDWSNRFVNRLHIVDTSGGTTEKTSVAIEGNRNNNTNNQIGLHIRTNLTAGNGNVNRALLIEHTNAPGDNNNNRTSALLEVLGGNSSLGWRTGLTVNPFGTVGMGTIALDSVTQLSIAALNIGNSSSNYILKGYDSGFTEAFYVRADGQTKIRNLSGLSTQMVVADTNGVLSVQAIPTGGSGGGGSVNNGINTFTAGTSTFQSVNITGASLDNIYVSGNSIFESISAVTITATTITANTIIANSFSQNGFVNQVQSAYLSSAFSTTSSSLTDVTGISFSIGQFEVWQFEIVGEMSGNTANGQNHAISVPTGAILRAKDVSNTNSVTAFRTSIMNASNTQSSTVSSVANTLLGFEIRGTVSGSSTSGTVQFRLKSNTASDTETIQDGTYLFAHRIR